MLDYKNYLINNDDDMESLIIDYLKNKKEGRRRAETAVCQSFPDLGKGWPHYKNADIPGFYERTGSTYTAAAAKTGFRAAEELLGGIAKSIGNIIKSIFDEEGITHIIETSKLKRLVDKILDRAKISISELNGIEYSQEESGVSGTLLKELVGSLVVQELAEREV